jgi:apolipoprotein N-acyltransferase
MNTYALRSTVHGWLNNRSLVAVLHGDERAGSLPRLALWTFCAAGLLQAAFLLPNLEFLVVFYLFSLLQLARAESPRRAFYSGLAAGMLVAAGQLDFFWRIFGPGATVLWLVFSIWIALFVLLAHTCLQPANRRYGWWLLPFVWCALEYFRSELYPLRFSWVSPGYAFGNAADAAPLGLTGTYGMGFVLTSIAGGGAYVWPRSRLQAMALLLGGVALLRLAGMVPRPGPVAANSVRVAGVQMEFPTEKEVLVRLNELVRKHPEAELIVLSEYTFNGPVPESVKAWCRAHGRYLIAGGKAPVDGADFYNSAFVVSPAGKVVFRQAKSVPIQFFKDGLPAPEQRVWNSPWGKLGICICYDLSYSRVTDRLVRSGAEALIVPTMDVVDWGERQHALHARIAPVRAAEYNMPVFRLASSGISQLVDASGRVLEMAPCPGDGATLQGVLELRGAGKLPWDRWLAPIAVALTALVGLAAATRRLAWRFHFRRVHLTA